VQNITEHILAIDSFVWQPFAMPLVLVLVGGLVTVATGFVQIRKFPLTLRFVIAGAFRKKSNTDGTITPFQALATALASTVGNGNIGGVATAILLGGPGAIAWMWLCGAVGMATKYAEATLGVHYRVRRETGELASGPMYYITQGLQFPALSKVLASMFAFFGACAALFGTGNMAQSNTVARTFVEAARLVGNVEIPTWVPGILITTAVGMVLLGGIRRIAAVAERLVPGMILVYFVVSLAFLVINITDVPRVFALIISSAFTPAAPIGGFIGASLSQVVAAGISRGVLSNEAGLGSAPIAHGIANVNHPCEQGTVGIFEVFIDTIVVCSLTAFVILASGLWTNPAYQNASGDLTAAALSVSVPYASLVVALCSFLFGFSTLLGWSYYGEKCIEFLAGSKAIMPYRVLFTSLIMLGAVVSVELVWAIGTLLNGFMAFPNLIGLLFLVGTIRRLTKDYFSNPSRTEI